MVYSTICKGGKRVYTFWKDGLEISCDWLYEEMKEKFDWGFVTYCHNRNTIDLFGNFPKTKVIEIKKFFYDNYPLVTLVIPRRNGIKVYFNIKVTLIKDSEFN